MLKSKWIFGAQIPHATQDISKPIPVPVSSADSKRIGLENFGNTCYANSVLQALYFCAPFRDLVLQSIDHSLSQSLSSPSPSPAPSPPQAPPPAFPPPPSFVPVRRKPERKPSSSSATDVPPAPLPIAPIPTSPPTLFSALRSLFYHMSTHPAERATVAPRVFIDKFREVNEDFRSTMHQDAHEFFNFLLNRIVEEIEEERKPVGVVESSIDDLSTSMITTISSGSNSNSGQLPRDATLVHKLFEGVLTSETRCLTCETVSSRDESFLDLSIDIEQNSSVTACLRQFSASEMLCHKNKFFCDACCDLQEAEKRMKIKKLPNVLALHLKRFKYQEDFQKSEIRLIKLSYRVAFPLELRLFNTVDDADDADRLYNLFAIVVHIGTGPHHGHYVSLIKTLGAWLLFDDETVSSISEYDIPRYFGDSGAGAAYVLYYQAADINLPALGLRDSTPSAAAGSASHSHSNSSSNVQPYAEPMSLPVTSTSTSSSTSTSTTVGTSPDFPHPIPHPIPVHSSPAHNSPVLPPGLVNVEDESSDLSSDPLGSAVPLPRAQSYEQVDGIVQGKAKGVNGVPVGVNIDGTTLLPPSLVPSQPEGAAWRKGEKEVTRPVSRGGLFKSIRKTPSMTIKTGFSAFSHGTASPTSGSASPVLNPNPSHYGGAGIIVEGRRSISPLLSPGSPSAGGSSSISAGASGSESKRDSGGKRNSNEARSFTAPPTAKLQRPTTAAAGGGRSGRPGPSSVPLVPLRRPKTAVGSNGERSSDEKRGSVNLNLSAEAVGTGAGASGEKEKEKEKKLGWFGKRKSMKVAEKDKEKDRTMALAVLDAFSSPRSGEDAQLSTWFKSSTQKPHRPSAEVHELPAPLPSASASASASPVPVPVPANHQPALPLHLPPHTYPTSKPEREREREHKHRHGHYHYSHQHPHPHAQVHEYPHGPPYAYPHAQAQEAPQVHPHEHPPQPPHAHVHPTQPQHYAHVRQPSKENGTAMGMSRSLSAHSHAHKHGGHGRGLGDGHEQEHSISPHRSVPLPQTLAPRMQMSHSTPTPMSPPVPPISLPARKPSVPPAPASPGRKKSMPSLLISRDRGREKQKEREREDRERLAGRIGRPSTAGAVRNGGSGDGNEDRSLPAVPPLPPYLQGHHIRHPSEGSVNGTANGNGSAMLVLDGTLRTSPSPTRGSVDPPSQYHGYLAPLHGNTVASGSASTGSGSGGSTASSNLKRATRKLSLSGPILGFGKRDKDKEREREREREREKGAPSAYLARF